MEDVTIEDDVQSNEEVLSKSEIRRDSIRWSIFQMFGDQWIFVLFFSTMFFIFVSIYVKRRRSSNRGLAQSVSEDDHFNRYEQMERIRERQQKAYEEQAARHAQQIKSKMENSKTNEGKPLKYRRNDHNPLTGQSESGSSNSCSWRPSSRGKGAGG